MKVLFSLSVLIFLLNSCVKKTPPPLIEKKRNFTSFEFSYKNRPNNYFTIRIDSNKIFFSPRTWDTLKYGIIPDTLFALIENSVSRILSNKPPKSKEVLRSDSSVIAIMFVANKDTIKITQSGKEIENVFYKMIAPMELFIAKYPSTLNKAYMILETEQMTIHTPEPPTSIIY